MDEECVMENQIYVGTLSWVRTQFMETIKFINEKNHNLEMMKWDPQWTPAYLFTFDDKLKFRGLELGYHENANISQVFISNLFVVKEVRD